jgi:hypothetical protein
MINTIKKALADNKRVYVVYTTGKYKGQITRIANLYQLENKQIDGNFEIQNITTDAETLSRMVRKA